jgi:hypothetical protein
MQGLIRHPIQVLKRNNSFTPGALKRHNIGSKEPISLSSIYFSKTGITRTYTIQMNNIKTITQATGVLTCNQNETYLVFGKAKLSTNQLCNCIAVGGLFGKEDNCVSFLSHWPPIDNERLSSDINVAMKVGQLNDRKGHIVIFKMEQFDSSNKNEYIRNGRNISYLSLVDLLKSSLEKDFPKSKVSILDYYHWSRNLHSKEYFGEGAWIDPVEMKFSTTKAELNLNHDN